MLKKKVVYFILLLAMSYQLSAISGCAYLKETAKGIAGLSTKDLESGRESAVKKTYSYGYDACYKKVKAVLSAIGSYIYAEDPKKQMIAIYVSKDDTTPVGIFFKEVDATHTQVEVSSPGTYAKELISEKIASELEGSYSLKQEKGKLNEER